MSGVCTKEIIESVADACTYVKDVCGDQHKFLNFTEFYYCSLDQNVPLIILISILFILFIFNILGSTADRYLSPALEAASDRMKLSEAIAGVTLVALANGATDVVAGLVAGTKDQSTGFPIAVGALFGACLFTVTCVLARCLQGSATIKVDSSSFVRDVSFLLLATVYFIFLTIINEITPALASVFFMFYVGYFAIVIYQNKKKEKHAHSVTERLLESKREISRFGRSKTIEEIGTESLLGSYVAKKTIKRMLTRGKSLVALGSQHGSKIFAEESPRRRQLSGHSDEEKNEEDQKLKNSQGSGEAEEEEDNSLFGKIMRIYEYPLNFIRDITMPPFDDERWNVYMAAVTPFFGLLFIIWQFGLFEKFAHHWYLWLVYAVLTIPIAAWILIKGRDHNLGEEHAGKFAVATFALSAVWLMFIVNCFMDFLSMITIISGMPLNYLSLTMLAWGNSLDDFFVDYQICKSGHGPMAVTGVYAGQLFNLLIGFGGSMFIQSLQGEIIPNIYKFPGKFGSFDFQTDLLTVILLACVVTGLSLSMITAFLSKWTLGRKMMVFVLGFYITFFITVTILTFV